MTWLYEVGVVVLLETFQMLSRVCLEEIKVCGPIPPLPLLIPRHAYTVHPADKTLHTDRDTQTHKQTHTAHTHCTDTGQRQNTHSQKKCSERHCTATDNNTHTIHAQHRYFLLQSVCYWLLYSWVMADLILHLILSRPSLGCNPGVNFIVKVHFYNKNIKRIFFVKAQIYSKNFQN